MQPPPEKPTIVDRAISTVPARKRGTIQHKLKAWMENELAMEQRQGQPHSRRRPKPSMPKLPWNDK